MNLCDTCIYRNENEYHKPCIVYRDDCEHYEKEGGSMSREEAIKELQESHDIMRSYDIDESESRLMTALDMAIKTLEQEPKTGHWIEHEKGFWSCVNKDGEREGWIPDYECSECGSRAWKHKTNYCPHCGARMESEDEK